MSDFFGITASSGARLKKGKKDKVEKLMDKYDFTYGLNCEVGGGRIEIWGEDWPHLYLKSKNVDINNDVFEEFLEELGPFLDEYLVIQAVGNEKCIFPLAAIEIIVTQKGVVRRNGFEWSWL